MNALENMNCRVVPWSCDDEWKHVFDLLYSNKADDLQLGVDIVEIWKIRAAGGAKISLSIELTSDLVQCSLSIKKEGATTKNRLLLSAVFIRFVSLISDIDQVKRQKIPISKVCTDLGIPVWVSDLRNESAHSTLPSVDITMAALDICLNYLKESYWFPHWHILFEMGHNSSCFVEKLVHNFYQGYTTKNDLITELESLLKLHVDDEIITRVAKTLAEFCSKHTIVPIDKFIEPFVSVLGTEFLFSLIILTEHYLEDIFCFASEKLAEWMTKDHAKAMLKKCLRTGDLRFLSSEIFKDFFDLYFDGELDDLRHCLQRLRDYNTDKEANFSENAIASLIDDLESKTANSDLNVLPIKEKVDNNRKSKSKALFNAVNLIVK